jgi:hypothetical protein
MNGVVNRIFGWIDRNRQDEELVQLALRRQIVQTLEQTKRRGKGMTMKKMMTQIRQKRKRELWKQRKQRKRQRADLLEALMNPYKRAEILDSSDAANTRYKEDKETAMVRRFANRWKETALGNAADGAQSPGGGKRGSPSKVYPARRSFVKTTVSPGPQLATHASTAESRV